MNNIEQIEQFFNDSRNFTGAVKINESLASHTTMHVGGPAKIFLEPADSDSLIFALRYFIENDIKFFVLGGGSNVIISDDGLDAVISTRKMNVVKSLTDVSAGPEGVTGGENLHDSKIIELDSGASWGSVISFCKKNDLGGFESFTGLSGTVGGALFMNATCFGLSACDNLISVDYLDLNDMKIRIYEKAASDWGYKRSPFQPGGGVAGYSPQRGERTTECERGGRLSPFIILSAKFTVTNGFDASKSEKCMSDRKEKGHFRSPSAGSAFKNDAANGIIAGKVIDECGLKGFSVGGAQIASWHGNFIINPEQKASASDIRELSDLVKKIVFEKKGIRLENEILFVES
ncbi:UDP-N-acetylmuramate dehydrogenase [Treponema ruminis]|uniref:UDP-N-acetylenolpyruvoylglucosamine reductase n=1 Tax=Treponema ruminis TaxID=744515 RepID=A0A7W8G8X7_9SPIR|nr:UDP-N-acetylmuramate dehydrogenase [Treponema ruminis]MBB5226042.1 UDP-N-acetylmuramate dehydrogenase [Treponema ruminis]